MIPANQPSAFAALPELFEDPFGSAHDGTDFTDYFGGGHFDWIVRRGTANYYVKRCQSLAEAQKDLLAYNLIAGLMNVPSVIMPDAPVRAKLDAILKARHPDMAIESLTLHLVRLYQDYRASMLPITDLTQAIAAEIVFSMWINRRDAHNSNRVYVSGIPMFFDFSAAFEANVPGTSADFFRPGVNSGFVPNWRLWTIPQDKEIKTQDIRNLERGRPVTLHPVRDEAQFWRHTEYYRGVIDALPESHIRDVVGASISNPSQAKIIADRLCAERRRLRGKLDVARTFMTSPVPA